MTTLSVNLRETKAVPLYTALELDDLLATVVSDEFDLAVYLDLINLQQNATVPTEGAQAIVFTFLPQGSQYSAHVTGGQPGSANPDDLTVTFFSPYLQPDSPINPTTVILTHHHRQITLGDLSIAFQAIAAAMWNRSS